MRKIQSGGVTVSKRPLGSSDLERWSRTMTCYSGIIAYKFMLLDVVSTHLRMDYEFQDKSRILLEKSANFSVTELSKKQLFDIKTTLLRNEMNNKTLLNGFLSTTDFYATIKQKSRKIKSVSNFDDVNDHLFWTLLEAESVHLIYERQSFRYSEWDQFLGSITLSKYDKMQFQFRCLRSKSTCCLEVLTVIFSRRKMSYWIFW